MPPRLVSLGILVAWAVSASGLIVRDVLPDLLVGPPPDLRAVTRVDEQGGETTWSILVPDPNDDDPEGLRSVGQVVSRTNPQPDGHVQLKSDVTIDAGAFLRLTPLERAEGGRLVVDSLIDVDAAGNLNQLRSAVRMEGDRVDLLVLEGHVEDEEIVITPRGSFLPAAKPLRFPYRARGMVQDAMSPLERFPGLHVGQRWESRVVSPLTGQVETVHIEVVEKNVMIPWGDGLVPTFLIKTRMKQPLRVVTARTWARATDGLVLRQEVPLMIVTLVLERQPPPTGAEGTGGRR